VNSSVDLIRKSAASKDSSDRILMWIENSNNATTDLQQFVNLVDDSEFILGDWINSLLIIDKFQESRPSRGSFKSALGFLSCCCQANKRYGYGELSSLTKEMLEIHGFEGREE